MTDEEVQRPLILVSNRGPVTFDDDGDFKRGTGGLVTALTGLAVHREVVVGVRDPDDTAALAYAFEEAALRKASLVAVHAWDSGGDVSRATRAMAAPGARAIEQRVAGQLQALLADVQARYPDVQASYDLVYGHPGRALVDEYLLGQILGTGFGQQIARELDGDRPLRRYGLVRVAAGDRPFAGLTIDPASGHLYVYATRTQDSTGGVVCVDTTLPQSTPNPAHGERWTPSGRPQNACPALPGRYGPMLFAQLDGSKPKIGGMTKNNATSEEMPAAVLRIRPPSASPMTPTSVI